MQSPGRVTALTDLRRDIDPADWATAVEVDEAPRRPGTVANRSLE